MIEPYIPHHLRESLSLYLTEGILPGNFLRAVLSHDLFEAMGSADEGSLEGLPGLVSWIYNYAPMNCHGTAEKITAWCSEGGVPEFKDLLRRRIFNVDPDMET